VLVQQTEDAVQEVFVHFLRPGSLLDGGLGRLRTDAFRGYLYGLVRNVALMTERRAYRSRELQSPSSVDLAAIEASKVEFSAAFDRAWARSVVAEAMTLMEERARSGDPAAGRHLRLIRGRHVEDASVQELARREGCSRGIVYREMEAAGIEFYGALKAVLERQAGGAAIDVGAQCRRISELLQQ
jgi:hypothetical protein